MSRSRRDEPSWDEPAVEYDDWMELDATQQRRTRRSRRARSDRFPELPGEVEEEYTPWVGGPPLIPRASGRDWDYPRHADEDAELPGDKRFMATFTWTIIWYLLPVAGYAGWTRTLSGTPERGACTQPVHSLCPPARSTALDTLMHSLPEIGLALAIALLVAMVIRMASSAWRPITVAFAASVIGAGVATILFAVVSG